MIALCTRKFYNTNNQIIGYELQLGNGNIKRVKSDQLKYLIANNKIRVLNLKLTSDGKLISSNSEQTYRSTLIENIILNTLETKPVKIKPVEAKSLEAIMLDTLETKPVKIKPVEATRKSNLENELKKIRGILGPDYDAKSTSTFMNYDTHLKGKAYLNRKIIKLYDGAKSLSFKSCVDLDNLVNINIKKIDNNLYVHADSSSNITIISPVYIALPSNCHSLFSEITVEHIDLDNVDTSEVTHTVNMFRRCRAKSINFRNFDSSKIVDMASMFMACIIHDLDISNFNTYRVRDMYSMFYEARINRLKLPRFDMSNLENMGCMFAKSEILGDVTLTHIDIYYNNVDMRWVFSEAHIDKILLGRINIRGNVNMQSMFSSCRADQVLLDSINILGEANMGNLFGSSRIKEIELSQVDISGYCEYDYMLHDCYSNRILIEGFRSGSNIDRSRLVYGCSSPYIFR